MEDPLVWLVSRAQEWVRAERATRWPRATPLPDRLQAILTPFFGSALVESVRYQPVLTIPTPPYWQESVARGIRRPVDFSQLEAATFQDVVVVSQGVRIANADAVMFHEVIHVLQYAILGLDEFLQRYMYGFGAGGFDYYTNPLEQIAFRLQARFEADPHTPFAVGPIVRADLAAETA